MGSCNSAEESDREEIYSPEPTTRRRRNRSRSPDVGCCNSAEESDQEEIYSPVPTTDRSRSPNVVGNRSQSLPNRENVPNGVNNQDILFVENETPQPTQSESFVPLKDRYFGSVFNLRGEHTLASDLIANLVFSGWKVETESKNPNIVNVPPQSAEGQAVINIFSKTSGTKLVITGISRIENVFLYAMYLLKKEEMEQRNGHVDELNLFHGTKQENLTYICNDNFDWRRYGDSVGNRFGKGVSFTPRATYAANYCDDGPVKVMFLVKVLVSKAMIGDENMSIPINTYSGKVRFNDTSVKPNIDVVVKYGDNEFYPAYIIITFSVKNQNTFERHY